MKQKVDIKTTGNNASNCQQQADAINGALCVVEFDIDGTILAANENFLECMAYTLEDIADLSHDALLAHVFNKRSEYQQYWKSII